MALTNLGNEIPFYDKKPKKRTSVTPGVLPSSTNFKLLALSHSLPTVYVVVGRISGGQGMEVLRGCVVFLLAALNAAVEAVELKEDAAEGRCAQPCESESCGQLRLFVEHDAHAEFKSSSSSPSLQHVYLLRPNQSLLTPQSCTGCNRPCNSEDNRCYMFTVVDFGRLSIPMKWWKVGSYAAKLPKGLVQNTRIDGKAAANPALRSVWVVTLSGQAARTSFGPTRATRVM
eukprot:3254956-Amphidinium_carterae.1